MSKNTEDFKELLESVLNDLDSFMVHVFENSGEADCNLDEIYTESHHHYRQSYAVKNAEETHRVLKAIMQSLFETMGMSLHQCIRRILM